jgi:N-acyl-D-aspartate/D-glutamate deacylase
MSKIFDTIILNGKVIDGNGNPWFKADIGIKNGKILKVGNLRFSKAEKIINAEGLIVCPGFIDSHSHSDISIIFNPILESSIKQGITTLIVGNCGMSLAPVNPSTKDLLLKDLSPFVLPGAELKIEWKSFKEYLNKEEEIPFSSNIVHLVGHGTVRIAVMGFENREPNIEELGKMKELIAEAMEAGAIGMSSGLIYPPGAYSKTWELIELSKTVAKYGGIYCSHIRGEGATLIEAIKEAIEIGEKANIPVHISHHKASGKNQWGKTKETLALIENARKNGLGITFDQYPYEAGMTSLSTLLPYWVQEGGLDKMLDRLKSKEIREKIVKEVEEDIVQHNLIKECGWENIYISYVKSKENKYIEGKNLKQISKIREESEFDTLFNILIEEEGQATMIIFSMSEEDIKRLMKHNLQMFGTDSWAIDLNKIGDSKLHPRFYGTYPKVFRKYVKEEKLLSLEEAIRKMTSFPAQRFFLMDRGIIKEGMWADIVIFNLENIKDKATYENPHQYPEGIEYVLINGEIVIEKGEYTGAMPGKVLKPLKNKI